MRMEREKVENEHRQSVLLLFIFHAQHALRGALFSMHHGQRAARTRTLKCLNSHSFLMISGPTLSPVSLLCATCAPLQSGKVPLRQHRQ